MPLRSVRLLATAAVLAVLPATAQAQQAPPVTATAEIRDAAGNLLGRATFRQVADGVRVDADLSNVPGGAAVRGMHLHEFGKCDPPSFMSAGAHFNPTNRQHGLRNPNGPHQGDLDNLLDPSLGSNVIVSAEGNAYIRAVARQASVGPGASAVLDPDGAALLLHSARDDNRSNPDGMSGTRIACGVVTATR
jgi:Cu-Zn family superoxide dismutase